MELLWETDTKGRNRSDCSISNRCQTGSIQPSFRKMHVVVLVGAGCLWLWTMAGECWKTTPWFWFYVRHICVCVTCEHLCTSIKVFSYADMRELLPSKMGGKKKGRTFSLLTLIIFTHLTHFPLPPRPLKYPKFKRESAMFPGAQESRSLFPVFRGGFWEHGVRCPGERAVIF